MDYGRAYSLGMIRITAVLTALALLSGCLGPAHEIRPDELARLAATPVKERGQSIRVVQEVGGDGPPASGRVSPEPHVHTSTTIVIVEGSSRRPGRPAPPARAGSRPSARADGEGGSDGQGGNDADDAAALAVVAVILAGTLVFVLAATEGSRYDGWVSVAEDQPVYVQLADGQWVWLPLAELTPELAAQAQTAMISELDAPFEFLGRAPLDRVGATFGLELGGGTLRTPEGRAEGAGFLGRITLGGFPIQPFGILAHASFGLGETNGDSAFNGRYGLEAQYFPLAIDRFHMGLFGEGGYEQRIRDTRSDSRNGGQLYYGAGALFQLDLTTRLALTGRFGFTMGAGADDQLGLGGGVGLSIY